MIRAKAPTRYAKLGSRDALIGHGKVIIMVHSPSQDTERLVEENVLRQNLFQAVHER